MSQHTDWKHKRSKIAKIERDKNAHLEIMVGNKPSEKVRENFFRPAYGRIGERREDNC